MSLNAEIDECQSNPCVNGKCIDEILGWTCECDAGFEGKACESGGIIIHLIVKYSFESHTLRSVLYRRTTLGCHRQLTT